MSLWVTLGDSEQAPHCRLGCSVQGGVSVVQCNRWNQLLQHGAGKAAAAVVCVSVCMLTVPYCTFGGVLHTGWCQSTHTHTHTHFSGCRVVSEYLSKQDKAQQRRAVADAEAVAQKSEEGASYAAEK